MTNKEKQIEQIADAISKASDFLTYYECDIIAKNLIKGWEYTLTPKDSVVLSREEYRLLSEIKKKFETADGDEITAASLLMWLKELMAQERKETARKIITFLEDHCDCDSAYLVEQTKEYITE